LFTPLHHKIYPILPIGIEKIFKIFKRVYYASESYYLPPSHRKINFAPTRREIYLGFLLPFALFPPPLSSFYFPRPIFNPVGQFRGPQIYELSLYMEIEEKKMASGLKINILDPD